MSRPSPFLALAGWVLRRGRRHQPQRDPARPRILVIRRNRMGDMICTLPLLHALRGKYPEAHLAVACQTEGAPIAAACPVVNEVIVLPPGSPRWWSAFRIAGRLQGFDWVIAAKGGFDRRLARLAHLTGGAIRIGFERESVLHSPYYTDPVAEIRDAREHQIETLLRLLRPLGLTGLPTQLAITVSAPARDFAEEALTTPPFAGRRPFVLFNLSSTAGLKFHREDFTRLAREVPAQTNCAVAFVAAPRDQAAAREWAAAMRLKEVAALATPGPLELAALMERAVCLVTPEGGAAHLAAAVGTPAVVLWSEGPFDKWRSRGENHVFVRAAKGEETIPVERVWTALKPLLAAGRNASKT
jgi:ADP-heptose:LPS heptosyltransferase